VKAFLFLYSRDGGNNGVIPGQEHASATRIVVKSKRKVLIVSEENAASCQDDVACKTVAANEWVLAEMGFDRDDDDSTNQHYSMFFVMRREHPAVFRECRMLIMKRGYVVQIYTTEAVITVYARRGGKVSKTQLTQSVERCTV